MVAVNASPGGDLLAGRQSSDFVTTRLTMDRFAYLSGGMRFLLSGTLLMLRKAPHGQILTPKRKTPTFALNGEQKSDDGSEAPDM